MGNQVLKLLKAEIVNEQIFSGIISEARILASLFTQMSFVCLRQIHSRMATWKDIISMEFISGESLTSLIERKSPLEMEVAVAIQKDYLFGLTYAHDRSSPIVHRDINGDNIVLSYSKGKIRALSG